jgi:hypothetical protein
MSILSGFVRTAFLAPVLAFVAAANAEEPCQPGLGGYPSECLAIEKIIVCEWGPVVADDDYQFETFIGAVVQDCELTLAGLWIDERQYTAAEGRPHLALSLSDAGGRTWHRPGWGFDECEDLQGDPRRFLNDCYFSGCTGRYPYSECTFLPEDCSYVIDKDNWPNFEPGICGAGNGYLYLVGSGTVWHPGLPPTETVKSVNFSRSADRGYTWGPFDSERRLRHICDAHEYKPDRTMIAADPDPNSDDVYVFWNKAHESIIAVRSTDAGDGWGGWTESWPTVVAIRPVDHEVYSPRGVVDGDGTFYIAWTHLDYSSHVSEEATTQIHLRRWTDSAGWEPAIDPQDPEQSEEPYHVSPEFTG